MPDQATAAEVSWEHVRPSLLAAGASRTRAALVYSLAAAALGLLASGLLGYAFFRWGLSLEPDPQMRDAADSPPSLWGCWVLAASALGVSIAMLSREVVGGLASTPVTNARVLRLVEDRAARFGTFPPDTVQIAYLSEASIVDAIPSLVSRARRHLVLPASLLSVAAEPLLIAALDAQLARVAGTGRLAVFWRSRAEFLHETAARFRPLAGSFWFWGLAIRALEALGFGVVWSTRAIAGSWLEGHQRTHDERCAAQARQISPRLVEELTTRGSQLDAYCLQACRGVLAFGLLPTDPIEGFERWLTRAGSERAGGLGFADELSAHLALGYTFEERSKLRALPWAKIGRALETAAREHAARVTAQLTKRRRDVVGAAGTFGELLASLEADDADDIGRRLDPALPSIRDAGVRATHYNGLLFVALESLLLTALLDRGARFVDPLRAGSIAVRAHGEIVDVQAIVVAGLRDADGAAELRAWAERLQLPVEPTFYREDAETIADVPREARPFVAPRADSPGKAKLARANAARSVAVAAFAVLFAASAVGAVPFGLLVLQLGYRWLTGGGGSEAAHAYYPPLGLWTLWYVPVVFVVIALLGLQSPESPRRVVEGKIKKRVVKLAASAAKRHGVRPADRLILVADDPRRPQAELVDHVSSVFASTERRLLVSDAVVDPAWEGDLEDAFDRAFATVAGTGPFAAALRARIHCVTALAAGSAAPGRIRTRRRRFVDWLARWLARPVTWIYGSALDRAERDAAAAAVAYGDRREG